MDLGVCNKITIKPRLSSTLTRRSATASPASQKLGRWHPYPLVEHQVAPLADDEGPQQWPVVPVKNWDLRQQDCPRQFRARYRSGPLQPELFSEKRPYPGPATLRGMLRFSAQSIACLSPGTSGRQWIDMPHRLNRLFSMSRLS